MKILVIMGSPRKGDSYEVTQLIEKIMQSLGEVNFEYLWLKDARLELCKGCYACFVKGEKFCPLKDDRDKIENAMNASDGVIFASPVYLFNVTALMKNFMDRFAYLCHRPRYFNKYAMLVSTVGGGFGLFQTLQALDWAASSWGFTVVHKLGLTSFSLKSAALRRKPEHRIRYAATRFYDVIGSKEKFSPRLLSLIGFKVAKTYFAKADKENADFIYWNERGWLSRDARYYFPIRINIFKRIIASLIFKVARLGKSFG